MNRDKEQKFKVLETLNLTLCAIIMQKNKIEWIDRGKKCFVVAYKGFLFKAFL